MKSRVTIGVIGDYDGDKPSHVATGTALRHAADDGGARIIELPTHRFYLATGFLPQYGSAPGNPHPLITAFLEAVAGGRA